MLYSLYTTLMPAYLLCRAMREQLGGEEAA